MNNCPDCMTNEEAVGEGVRCARHEIELLKAEVARLAGELAAKDAELAAVKASYSERVAVLVAHRACCGNEHDAISKFHGYCVVCGVPWPCEYAGAPEPELSRLRESLALAEKVCREADITVSQWDFEIASGRPGIVYGSRMGQLKSSLAAYDAARAKEGKT